MKTCPNCGGDWPLGTVCKCWAYTKGITVNIELQHMETFKQLVKVLYAVIKDPRININVREEYLKRVETLIEEANNEVNLG